MQCPIVLIFSSLIGLLKFLLSSFIYFFIWSIVYWETFIQLFCYERGFVNFSTWVCQFCFMYVKTILFDAHRFEFLCTPYEWNFSWLYCDPTYLFPMCDLPCFGKIPGTISLNPYDTLTMWLWLLALKDRFLFSPLESGKLVNQKEEATLCTFQE